MAYIRTVTEEDAEGLLRDIYLDDRKNYGYVPNYTQAMSLRPEVIVAWRALQKSIRSHISLRNYELVTFAAALALKCSY
jgi:Zn-dependent M32 family carboxypeptidase